MGTQHVVIGQREGNRAGTWCGKGRGYKKQVVGRIESWPKGGKGKQVVGGIESRY